MLVCVTNQVNFSRSQFTSSNGRAATRGSSTGKILRGFSTFKLSGVLKFKYKLGRFKKYKKLTLRVNDLALS